MRRSVTRIVSILCTLFLLAGGNPSSVSAQSGPVLIIDDIVSTLQTEQEAYDVSIFFSLDDGNGDPIQDLAIGDVSLTEDDKQVDPTALKPYNQEPISVAILIDTSRSMAGSKLATATQAALRLISTLTSGDQAALISFDSQVTTQSDFTDNLSAVQEKVELLAKLRGSGTCLYDALYEGIQISASRPAGRRAIVVLADGEDILPGGGQCSTHTVKDVIDIATQTTTHVPIYTVGFNSASELEQLLEQLAAQTGGQYQFAFAAAQDKPNEVFQKLSEQLRSQYHLTYVSIAQPGPHILVLNVDWSNIHEQSSRDFSLPPFPYRIVFVNPQEGEEIRQEINLKIEVKGQGEGEKIAKVEFFADGKSLGVIDTPPYELLWEPSFDNAGAKLDAVAYGEAGGELARNSIDVTLEPPGRTTRRILVGGAVVLLLVIVGALALMRLRPRRREQEGDREWMEKVRGEEHFSPTLGEERTLDSFMPSENALGILIVLQSDDPAMIGQQIEIAKPMTNLGRKADNDVIFAKDSTVSRHHAAIEERGGNLFLSEVLALDDGSPKHPAYGTFINGLQVEDPVLLHDGDEIRLGKRVRLRFQSLQPTATDEERTTDQFDSGDERTMDSSS